MNNTSAWVQAEAKTVVVKKYYTVPSAGSGQAAGQRVAMRATAARGGCQAESCETQLSAVYWLHGDHLGSTSLTTNETGAVVAEQKYLPYGEVRWVTGTLPTDFGYTGQRADGYIKLTQMGARWYSEKLGRWISADPIIPGFANSQSFNRYMYVFANPLKLIDTNGYDPKLVLAGTEWTLAEISAARDMAIMVYREQPSTEKAMIVAAHVLWRRAGYDVRNVYEEVSKPDQFQGYKHGPPSATRLENEFEKRAWNMAWAVAKGVIKGEEGYQAPPGNPRFFANILQSEEITYMETLARVLQEGASEYMSMDEALSQAGYGSFEYNTWSDPKKQFVYNRGASIGVYGPGAEENGYEPYTVKNPRKPFQSEEEWKQWRQAQ